MTAKSQNLRVFFASLKLWLGYTWIHLTTIPSNAKSWGEKFKATPIVHYDFHWRHLLTDIRYADDMMFFATEAMQQMMESVKAVSEE